MIFYVTFGQQDSRKNGWYEITADNYDTVLDFCNKNKHMKGYSIIYSEPGIEIKGCPDFDKSYFPNGVLGKLVLTLEFGDTQIESFELQETLSDRHLIIVE